MITPSTRLRRAIELRSLPLIRRVLSSHSDDTTLLRNADPADHARTSLHVCAAQGLTEIAIYLLDLGHEDAGVSRDTDGQTPLMVACQAGSNDDDPTVNSRIEIGRMLIDRFPETLCARDKKGMDAFSHAAASGTNALLTMLLNVQLEPFAMEAMQDFTANEVDPLVAIKEKEEDDRAFKPTTKKASAGQGQVSERSQGQPNFVTATSTNFAGAYAFLNVRDAAGNTPLHHASATGQLKTVRLLISAGADGGARNAQTWTPVDYSASVSAEVYLRQLIKEQLAQMGIATGSRAGSGRNSPAGFTSPTNTFVSPTGVSSPIGFGSPGSTAGRQSPIFGGRLRGGSDERRPVAPFKRGRGESDEKRRAAGAVRLVNRESSEESEEETMIGRARTKS